MADVNDPKLQAALGKIEDTIKQLATLSKVFSLAHLSYVTDAVNVIEKSKKKTGQQATEDSEKLIENINRLWKKTISNVFSHFKEELSNTAKTFAGPGGLGQLGSNLGGMVGESIANVLSNKLKLGDDMKSSFTGIGKIIGTGIVDALQSIESQRMLGAKYAQIVTAGKGVRNDYTAMGGQVISQVNAIREGTGAEKDKILALADELSKLGIQFDETGFRATQYALASEKLLNLTEGTVAGLDQMAVRLRGEDWNTVTEVLQDVGEVTAAWRAATDDSNTSTLKAIASNDILAKMYMEVAKNANTLGLEMAGMNKVFLASVSVMGQMGMRPGMMSQVVTEFMSKMAPQVQGGVNQTLEQSYWLDRYLSQSRIGRKVLEDAYGVGKLMNIPKQMVSLSLNSILATNPDATSDMFGAFLIGIARDKKMFQGGPEERTTGIITQLAGGMHLNTLTANVMQKMAEIYEQKTAAGLSPKGAFDAISAAPEFREAAKAAGMESYTPEDILREAFGMGNKMLSIEQKMGLAAESLSALVITGISQSIPGTAAANDEVKKAIRDMTRRFGRVNAPLIESLHKERAMRQPTQAQPTVPRRKIPAGYYTESKAGGVSQRVISMYEPLEREYAEKLGTDPGLLPTLTAQIQKESGGNPGLTSKAGAIGPAQFMPETWNKIAPKIQNLFPGEHLDPRNPRHAVAAQQELMGELLNEFGDPGLALAAYNAKPSTVHKFVEKGRPLPSETINYLKKIGEMTGHNYLLSAQNAAAEWRRGRIG